MKLPQTALPLGGAGPIVPPPTFGIAKAGAIWPTWKLAVALADAAGEAPGLENAEADGLATADGDGESEADGDGDGMTAEATADGLGLSDAGGVAGIARMTPASTASATRTPATRPARTDSRGPISR